MCFHFFRNLLIIVLTVMIGSVIVFYSKFICFAFISISIFYAFKISTDETKSKIFKETVKLFRIIICSIIILFLCYEFNVIANDIKDSKEKEKFELQKNNEEIEIIRQQKEEEKIYKKKIYDEKVEKELQQIMNNINNKNNINLTAEVIYGNLKLNMPNKNYDVGGYCLDVEKNYGFSFEKCQ